ncbi:GTPase RsgA [Nocardia sp. 2YAB30]|uniref:GTPase RsgA n=1 Tax=unclassified Nocardia TaxID=2637762 RepID=UPI003F9E9443
MPLDDTVALIGPSGAGKFTLGNALLGAEVFATNAVRAANKKGRHTTVHRELRPLPGSGTLIDTFGCAASSCGVLPKGSRRPSAISNPLPHNAVSAIARTAANRGARCWRRSRPVR